MSATVPRHTLRTLDPTGTSRTSEMECGRMTANDGPGGASAITTWAPVAVPNTPSATAPTTRLTPTKSAT